jgi:hypothetical protein
MGFFSDIGNGFELKTYMKIQMEDMTKDNVVEIYQKCIDKAKGMDFSAGSLDNILQDMKSEFKKFVVWNDNISDNEEEEILKKLYKA